MALQNRLQETVAAVDTCIAANWQDDSSETREATQIADAYLALRAVKAQLEETTLLCQPKKTTSIGVGIKTTSPVLKARPLRKIPSPPRFFPPSPRYPSSPLVWRPHSRREFGTQLETADSKEDFDPSDDELYDLLPAPGTAATAKDRKVTKSQSYEVDVLPAPLNKLEQRLTASIPQSRTENQASKPSSVASSASKPAQTTISGAKNRQPEKRKYLDASDSESESEAVKPPLHASKRMKATSQQRSTSCESEGLTFVDNVAEWNRDDGSPANSKQPQSTAPISEFDGGSAEAHYLRDISNNPALTPEAKVWLRGIFTTKFRDPAYVSEISRLAYLRAKLPIPAHAGGGAAQFPQFRPNLTEDQIFERPFQLLPRRPKRLSGRCIDPQYFEDCSPDNIKAKTAGLTWSQLHTILGKMGARSATVKTDMLLSIVDKAKEWEIYHRELITYVELQMVILSASWLL